MADYTRIIYETLREPEGGIARITLNRPEKLNAIDGRMNAELMAALDQAERDDDVKVVILRGAGRAFSAGFDLGFVFERTDKTTGDSKTDTWRSSQRFRIRRDKAWVERLRRVFLFPKPTIAQVHGHCYGGGFYIALCCDITVVAEDARIGHMEQRLGSGGRSVVLPLEIMLVGWKKVREMLLLGDIMSGKEAAEIGLVNRAVPADQLETTVYKMAQTITLQPRDNLEIGKAQTELAYDLLGLSKFFMQGVLGHSMMLGASLAADEFNMHAVWKKKGLKEAIHQREARFERYS